MKNLGEQHPLEINNMETANLIISSCRYCRHYNPQGRRGGMCHQLGVPVQSSWKACSLAAYPFTNEWPNLEKIVLLEEALSFPSLQTSTKVEKSTGKAGISYA